MMTIRLAGVLIVGAVCGCAGGVDVQPMLRDFDRYESDVRTLSAGDEPTEVLDAARNKRAEAGALVESGKNDDAAPIAEKALADARLALEIERMDNAARRAESCRLDVERARTNWREAVYVLEQTEDFVGKKSATPRTAPETTKEMAELPATTLSPESFPPPLDRLSAEWASWRQSARELKVAAADLENVFARSMETGENPDVDETLRAHHAYLAARAVQGLEARVHAALYERVCLEASELTSQFGDARAAALRATLDLERGLQENLRGELDQLRAEARSRQDELYDALSQMEGKFARIRRDARGTIVSLADILFDFDKATLRRDVEFNLVKIATILNQFGEMNVVIEGHTDAIGTDEYNLDLSKRRAEAVHEFLISQDVARDRLTWEGYGESRPVADNSTDEGRQRNRRVDLIIQDAP